MKQFLPLILFLLTVVAFLAVSVTAKRKEERINGWLRSEAFDGGQPARLQVEASEKDLEAAIDALRNESGAAGLEGKLHALRTAGSWDDRRRTQSLGVPILIKGIADTRAKKYELWMPMIISIIVLFSALAIILSKRYETESLKWAYGMIGTIVGYWLRTTG